MSHHKKHSHPVPPDNQPQAGPPQQRQPENEGQQLAGETGGAQEQDPKRRLGNYEGAGEHSYQQPGGLNDANH